MIHLYVCEVVVARVTCQTDSCHGDVRRMLRIIPTPLGKIRPRIKIQITMEGRWRRRVEVDDHQALIIIKLERGTLHCCTDLEFLQKEQIRQTLGKTNVVSVSAKPSIQVVIHPTSVGIMHIIRCDKEVWRVM